MMRPRLPLREAPGHLFPRVAALGRARTEPCRLVVNIPPRHSKSSLVGVLGPAWLWLHRPEAQCICITKADRNAKRDARKMRQVITSEPYRRLMARAGDLSIAVDDDGSGIVEGSVRSLFIRPEKIRLLGDGGVAYDGASVFTGKVKELFFSGNAVRIDLDVGAGLDVAGDVQIRRKGGRGRLRLRSAAGLELTRRRCARGRRRGRGRRGRSAFLTALGGGLVDFAL